MFSINVFSKQLLVCLYFCPDDDVVDSICEQLSVNVASVRDKGEVCRHIQHIVLVACSL